MDMLPRRRGRDVCDVEIAHAMGGRDQEAADDDYEDILALSLTFSARALSRLPPGNRYPFRPKLG